MSNSGTTLGAGETQLAVKYGDNAWDDIPADAVEASGVVERAVLLPFGTRGGNPSVELLIRLPDGRLIHANTTFALWQSATQLFTHWQERR